MINASENAIITEYLLGKGNLTKAQKLRLKRCTDCADLIRQYGSRIKVVTILQNLYGINDSEAYQLYSDTQVIFNTEKKDTRNFHVDILLGYIVETRNKAMAAKDFKTVAVCDKNYYSVIKDFFGTEDKPDYAKLQPPEFVMGFFPNTLNTPLPNTKELAKQVQELLKVKKGGKAEHFDDAQEVNENE